ncbi:MAG: M23 family metallopeptidase [Nostoc sp. DedQUE08]|uniref:M23 family metallopeptidase n=1 Tax=unclassified Nostoc TaxID=2593658 RepID=UPI002AD51983|nr:MULTISPECIES: M23 family metallopeptidase [unclassified Nostoc]MDZ8065803.1 M23 family metallopeptidase [Nostoc sp. DedQUE08]MDZ8092148.1 M23 family metallopeptidase [Nostoc sp. DedQUE05]MDZ8129012.1 M23 family metallopeptidase [Nostoc sp. DedQUE07]
MNIRRLALISAFAVILPALSLSIKPPSADAVVYGQYKNIKLPFAAGQSRKVTGTHNRATGRHAIDFGMNKENVLAIRGGTVYRKAFDSEGGGNMLIIDHGDNFCSIYLHLNEFKVSEGQTVQQGQVIAISGNTTSVGATLPYHLHVSVTQKVNGVCSANRSQEIAMFFDEMPTRELQYPEFITSQNRISSSSIPFASPVSSRLSMSSSTVDLTVNAANLPGKTVYVQMWRSTAYGYAPKEWNFSKVASGTSITFNDLDGPGNTFAGVSYYTIASLKPIPAGEAAKQRTSCFSATGGQYLCDTVRR